MDERRTRLDTERLTYGLVGERNLARYRTSATFKTQVDLLVRLLPAWVDALADDAEEHDRKMEQVAHVMKSGVGLNAEEIMKQLGMETEDDG